MYLLIVTGMSGAGKSTCLHCLEELGYFCVDNLPSPLLPEFIRLCRSAVPEIRRAAVTVDGRESLLSATSDGVLQALDDLKEPYEILFLDARDDVLRKRYNETRRSHPLGDGGDAASGILRERSFLSGIRSRAAYVLDTSDIKAKDFVRAMAHVLPEYENKETTLLVSSFGYKRGVPVDADIVLDMRFLPNPFYVEELRHKSGKDPEVSDYVFSEETARVFLDTLEQMIERILPGYAEQEKHILRVCFGCTGGRHRSVAAAEELYRRFTEGHPEIHTRIYHRDLTEEAEDIRSRFSEPKDR